MKQSKKPQNDNKQDKKEKEKLDVSYLSTKEMRQDPKQIIKIFIEEKLLPLTSWADLKHIIYQLFSKKSILKLNTLDANFLFFCILKQFQQEHEQRYVLPLWYKFMLERMQFKFYELLSILKSNNHIKYKVSKQEKLEDRKEFRNSTIEEFKTGQKYLTLKDQVLNDKVTISWIENDQFQQKWDKFKKEMPKDFSLDMVKDKDEEIKAQKQWVENKNRENAFIFHHVEIPKTIIKVEQQESKQTLKQLYSRDSNLKKLRPDDHKLANLVENVQIPPPRKELRLFKKNHIPAQWLNVDLRAVDLAVFGKQDVIHADPPWDIHMDLPYGTMRDDEMKALELEKLCDTGFIFLWVTGRAMELARECLTKWGFTRIDEIVWLKISNDQKLIRTGRTGHWLNHSKEHCLVGMKGDVLNNSKFLWKIDTDVIVSEVRETSRKPDEVQEMMERCCPGGRKIELFGRAHNRRYNFMCLGNQLPSNFVVEDQIIDNWNTMQPDKQLIASKEPMDTIANKEQVEFIKENGYVRQMNKDKDNDNDNDKDTKENTILKEVEDKESIDELTKAKNADENKQTDEQLVEATENYEVKEANELYEAKNADENKQTDEQFVIEKDANDTMTEDK